MFAINSCLLAAMRTGDSSARIPCARSSYSKSVHSYANMCTKIRPHTAGLDDAEQNQCPYHEQDDAVCFKTGKREYYAVVEVVRSANVPECLWRKSIEN